MKLFAFAFGIAAALALSAPAFANHSRPHAKETCEALWRDYPGIDSRLAARWCLYESGWGLMPNEPDPRPVEETTLLEANTTNATRGP